MKKLFENWRGFVNETESGLHSFKFTDDQLKDLNKSIAKIVSSAKKVLNAEGPTPSIFPKDLERIGNSSSEPQEPRLKQVAEQEDEDELNSPEVVQLRKQYYGPGGELEKYGPRSAKNLDKGIGHMTATDFEESGYVMKVPVEVLESFEHMIEETKKTGVLFEQARDWYHSIRDLLNDETDNDRDAALLGLLIATYSPRAKFALNLAEAAFMYKAVKQDATENPQLLKRYLETFPGSEKKEPGSARGFTNASKVPNFALNIIAPELAGERDPDTGKLMYNDVYTWNSTIDTWMIDAFYPMLKKASTSKEWEAIKGKMMSNVVTYRYMARLVEKEARRLGLLPHELQAIVWVSMQIRQTGDSSLGVTTQFAVNQIKESIHNIRQINTDLADIEKEFEDKSWLKIFFDEIDSQGFESASRFLLGVKDEKGKTVTPGVRSITSKGKKGSAFNYYKEPPSQSEPTKAKEPKKAKVKPSSVKKPSAPKAFADKESEFSTLHTFFVMNEVIQMPTGKFNNLYDSITLYLSPDFSTQKAVEFITGRFNPDAKSSKDYFKESITIKIGKRVLR